MEKAIDVASLRQNCISNNIAHVGTPGYHCQEITDFESTMQDALQKWHEGSDDAEKQAGEDEVVAAEPTVETAPTSGVDMNREMANMAKAQILYNAMSRQISGYYSSLKYVTDNSGR